MGRPPRARRLHLLAAQVLRQAQDPAWPVPSPCSGVCRIDEAGGLCQGCWRTLDEIAAWSRLDNSAKMKVWRQLRERTA